jgi:hypothetical protein
VVAERVLGAEENILGLVSYKESVSFQFSHSFLQFLLLRILQID